MKTILEIFYLRIMGQRVRYQRKQVNRSKKGGDPNHTIQSFLQEKHKDSAGKVEEREFVVHSTSWRYMKPDKIMLTYVAYSDELEFKKGNFHSLPLKKLKTITKKESQAAFPCRNGKAGRFSCHAAYCFSDQNRQSN